jgi:hypothetical protein
LRFGRSLTTSCLFDPFVFDRCLFDWVHSRGECQASEQCRDTGELR